MRLGLRRPSGAWSKGRQTGSQAQGWHGFTLRISLSVLKAMGSHSGMLRKGGMQTDSGLELIMLGGGWRGRPVGRERVRASLDQGDGKYRKKDTGSRETRAVKQLGAGPGTWLRGRWQAASRPWFVHLCDGAAGGGGNTGDAAELGGS